MSESKQCPKCESQLPQRLFNGTIICRQCGWSGRLESNLVEVPAKDNKSTPLLNFPAWKSTDDFIKTRNGERILLVIGTFIISSAFWYIFSPFKNQNNSLNSSPAVTAKSQDTQSSNASSSVDGTAISQSTNYSVKIHLKLKDTYGESSVGGSHDNCYGSRDKRGFDRETPITIKDGTGKILAIGKLGAGSYPQMEDGRYAWICNFESTLNNIPKSDFYSISFGSREAINYSFDEMQKQDWVISLSIG